MMVHNTVILDVMICGLCVFWHVTRASVCMCVCVFVHAHTTICRLRIHRFHPLQLEAVATLVDSYQCDKSRATVTDEQIFIA